MGKLIANTNCEISVTITGGPSVPSAGEPSIITPPSASVKAGGAAAYSGQLIVQVPLISAEITMATPAPGTPAICTIIPTGTSLINGKPVVLQGDTSATVLWAGAISGSPPTPCTGTVQVTVTKAGQSTVFSN
jgi:hypothetical protein